MLWLAKPGLIRGTVVYGDGDSPPRSTLRLWRRAFRAGNQYLEELGSAEARRVQTDGSFAIDGLPPGRYYLSVCPDAVAADSGSAPRSEGAVLTFYPGAADDRSATPIDVLAGAQIADIRLHMRRERLYRIKGKASSGDERVQYGSLGLLVQSGTFGVGALAHLDPDGSFEIRVRIPGRPEHDSGLEPNTIPG